MPAGHHNRLQLRPRIQGHDSHHNDRSPAVLPALELVHGAGSRRALPTVLYQVSLGLAPLASFLPQRLATRSCRLALIQFFNPERPAPHAAVSARDGCPDN